jgi:NAD(P)-dependent dehydrogenase (short-subunit alcohol dehydrogenase family)
MPRRKQFETKVFGLLSVTRAALPVLRAQGSGHFTNFSSFVARRFPGKWVTPTIDGVLAGMAGLALKCLKRKG